MPEKKNVTYFYAVDDTDVLGYKTEDVYFINESCTINVDNLSGTIIIDETSAGAPLGIVLEGEFSNDLKILTNNTAKYTTDGNVLSVYGPTDYEQTITVNGTDTTVKGNGAYAGRTEVLFFLKSGFGTAEKDTTNNMNLIISTGMYDAATKKVFDIVSNPVYPGKDAYADLNGAGDGEMWKFMLVPNSVMFGQVNTNYALANIFVSSVMLMSSSTVSRGGMYYAIASGNIKYREEHSSIAYVGTFTDQNGNASSKNFMCAGMMLVSSVGVKNLPMVAYIGDANRPGSSNTNPGKEYDPAATSSDDQGATNDPNASDGKDYFSNDHLGAS